MKLRHTNGDIEIENDETQPLMGSKSNVRPSKTLVPPRPAPRQVLKVRSAGQKSTTSSEAGASITVEKQATTRKRPVDSEGEDVDDGAFKTPVPPSRYKVGPPSKKVKGSTQALRNTGLFFRIGIGGRC
jgi:hypothetical protein